MRVTIGRLESVCVSSTQMLRQAEPYTVPGQGFQGRGVPKLRGVICHPVLLAVPRTLPDPLDAILDLWRPASNLQAIFGCNLVRWTIRGVFTRPTSTASEQWHVQQCTEDIQDLALLNQSVIHQNSPQPQCVFGRFDSDWQCLEVGWRLLADLYRSCRSCTAITSQRHAQILSDLISTDLKRTRFMRYNGAKRLIDVLGGRKARAR